jgi:phosphoribosyl 1,2-cyclic phosphate phosphodiesterase
MKVRILGCGSSGGVPLIGCSCPVCTSTDPRNKRTRVSVVVDNDDTRILIDASPDLRQQFLSNGLTIVDAAILTHAHADHLHGIDDLRAVNFLRKAPLDVWGLPDCLAQATRRFDYAFAKPKLLEGKWWVAPSLVPRPVDGTFTVGSIRVDTYPMSHGGDRDPVLGLRLNRFAYSTDCKELPEAAFEVLAGIDVWVVDCLMETPNYAHSHLAQSLAWIERVRPRRAILTHMNHTVDYANWTARLPPGVELAYDGMVVDVE